MSKITVVGMGLCENDITLSGAKAIAQSDYVIVKTAKGKTYGYFEKNGIKTANCDGIYNAVKSFDELNEKIAERVKERARTHKNTVFCVNGAGYDDASVALLKQSNDVELTFIHGVSNASSALTCNPSGSYSAFTSSELLFAIAIETRLPLVITEVYDKDTASEVKLKLFEFYDDEHPCYIVNGTDRVQVKLYEIDAENLYDYDTALLLLPLPLTEKKKYGYTDFVEILRVLRGENGCVWDKAQTHESIRHNTIEEAYELAAAVDDGNIDGIIEESGDLLMQSLFHAEMAREAGEFDYIDMYTTLCTKLIFRHTHIFGNDNAVTPEEALNVWEKNKLTEKKLITVTQNLKDVPQSMAALMRAEKVQHRAAKVGFDWADKEGAIQKVLEEIGEVKQAMASGDQKETEKELGDLIFALVNVCRFVNVDPEVALTGTTNKFIKRFSYIEEKLKERGKTPKESTLEEMDNLWNEAKRNERVV